MNRLFTIFIILLISATASNSQFLRHTSVAVGLSTTQILGSNPGKLSIQPSGEVEPYVFGGGFIGALPGLEIRLTVPIDEERRWRVPFGVDFQFYSAKERVPVGSYIEDHWEHTFEVVTPYIGLSYVMQDLKFLKAKTYLSCELRVASISNITSIWREHYLIKEYWDLDTTIFNPTKPETTRFGGILRAGVEGKLFDPIQLNASIGLSLMNVFGRDDSRKELLTPFRLFEMRESYVWNLNFSLLFQYTF
jgi:hypothetical protein